MPNWKKLITSGSDAQLNSLNVTNSVTASSLTVSGSITGANYIDFSTVATVPYNEGRLFYDQENGALAFYNEEADITLQIGQEFYKRVFNKSGNLIANGTPVRISGSQGDVPNIYPAISADIYSGSYDAQENKIIGLATHNIEDNTIGYVTEFGIVRGIDTSAFAAGEVLYLQTGSAGFRNTPPPFPFNIVPVGEVVRSQANGFIEVRTAEPITSENISGIINIETEVISDESITIQKGTPVHVVSEGNGPIPRVKIAKSSDSNLMPATFVVEEDIISGSQGTALSTGYIYNVDTSAFTVGDIIFVAPNGGYTNVKPTGSNLIQNLGVVLKVDATKGSGFVYGSGRSNDVPNIPENYLWIGNADGVPTPVSTGSLSGSFLLNTTDTFTGTLTVEGKVYQTGLGSSSYFGFEAGLNDDLTANSNTGVGYEALKANTSGFYNTALGHSSLNGNTSGARNTAVGFQTLAYVTTGSGNVALGYEAGTWTPSFDLPNSLNSTYIGAFTQPSGVSNTNEMIIGYNTIGKGSNTTVIGNSNTTHTYVEGLITGSSLEIGGNITVSGSILPEHELYDLGSATQKWRDLYLSGSSIYIGDEVITERAWSSISSSVLNKTIISSSAQIASDISGSFTLASSSFSTRVSTVESNDVIQNARLSSLQAATGSYLLNTTDTLTGNLTVTGKVTAQEFHTDLISSSIIYQSGSTKFGDTSDDIHQFTGSLSILSGSISLKDDADNIVIGEGASAATPITKTSSENIVIGRNAGNPGDLSSGKTGNIIIGDGARMPRGAGHVVIGENAMANVGTNGSSRNTAIGGFAMQLNNGGTENVAIGHSSCTNISTGDNNVFVGYAASPKSGTDSNSIGIGNNADGKGPNTARIGNSSITHTYIEGIITGSSDLNIPGNIVVGGTVDGIDIATDVAANTSKVGYTDSLVKTKLNLDNVVSGSATQVRTFLNVADGANNYTLPEATSTVRGGIELFSDTDQSVAANTVSTTAGRTYGLQLNAAGQAVVNVPWVDTDTTYTRSSFINQDVNNNNNVHFEGLMVGQTTGATANTIRCIGDVVAYYSSDIQFKDNVTQLDGALDKVKQIRGVSFDWNDKQDVYEGHDIGVIAQEVEKVYPELVHHREHNDSKAVDYVKLTAVLIEAVKELAAKVEKLESK